MKTLQEIQDKIFELQTIQNKKDKKYLQFKIDMLNWVLEKSNTCVVSTDELQKDGINIEFGWFNQSPTYYHLKEVKNEQGKF